MNILQAIILGIVQGVSEFLPISSSGHLAVLHQVFGIEKGAFTFDIVVHLGSLVAVIVYFWADIVAILKNPFRKITGLLIVGTIPAVVAGFFLRGVIDTHFRTGIWLAAAFTLTGVLLVMADKFTKVRSVKRGISEEADSDAKIREEEQEISWLDALFIGCCQALAIPPGISRSGTTITGGLARGLKRETAARFSFLLAIIAIAGAGALEVMEEVVQGEGANIAAIGIVPIIVGFIVSAVVGYLCIRLLLKLIKACKLKYFSYYLWGLALLIFVDWIVFNRFF
ncbi:MAG: undecaprenyl-diphosphate phosphatase [Defluviitaleaceae bacterium]|nr:undecaprenyl-diphosphate phosphatase [Defluviitaleaceae bacterium]